MYAAANDEVTILIYRTKLVSRTYPNLLLAVMPAYANHIWAADFTELVQHGKKVYVATAPPPANTRA